MEFFTIKANVQAEIIEKKSKFIANLFPIQGVKEAENLIREIRKKYHDARHNCMAYRIVENDQIMEKSSDDGEPSGTAGANMLTILRKNDLANVLIVVTRYFGGILLGTGGLTRAYSDSLMKAMEQSERIRKCKGIEIQIITEYAEWESFKYYCKNHEFLITDVEYSDFIVCKIELEHAKKQILLQDFEAKHIILKDVKEITEKYITKSIVKR